MEQLTDALLLWRQMVEATTAHQQPTGDDQDAWIKRARWFDACVRERWQHPDSSRDFIVRQLQDHPGATILDIGAGTGAWAVHLARHARHVTAVEPSAAMITVMQENIAREGITNVTIIQDSWPEAEVEAHDFALCSHAMYGCADLAAFIRAMEHAARTRCFLMLRVPVMDSPMAEAARHLWGQPYDSTNFQLAYNALLQMDIHADVLMENTGLWKPWTSPDLDAALANLKDRFGITGTDEHDPFLRDLLTRHLTPEDDHLTWPRGVRSALVHWATGE